MLLPHDRVGSDFSWLQARSQEDSPDKKAKELEDEESFLYGNEETSKSSTALFAAYARIEDQAKPQERDASSPASHQKNNLFSSFGDVPSLKQTHPIPSTTLHSYESEKIKDILKGLGTADISDILGKMQGWKEGKQQSPAFVGSDPAAVSLAVPALRNPNVRQALESLQSLIKGQNLLSETH